MAFCTKCGHKNVADARFCESCGTPLQLGAAAPSAPAPHPSSVQGALTEGKALAQGPSKRLLMLLAAGLVGLVILGTGLALLLAPERASKASFTHAINRILLSDPSLLRDQYCLQTLNYSLDPLVVNSNDRRTQSWMALLTEAGLYSGPETINRHFGFLVMTQLKYTRTEAGRKATHNNMLCIADGLEVAEVLSFSPPQQVQDTEVSVVTVRLALRNPMPWTQTDVARQIDPTLYQAHSPTASNNLPLMLQDGKWVLATPAILERAQAQQLSQARSPEQPGWLANLPALLGFGPANPLLGTWTIAGVPTELFPGLGVQFEFSATTMTTLGVQIPVRYQFEGDRVVVHSSENNQILMNVRVVGPDTLMAAYAGENVRLTRVK